MSRTAGLLIVGSAVGSGIAPLAWLAVVRRPHAAHWWWLAAAFAVSFVADVMALTQPPFDRWWLQLVYPIAQSGLIGAVLLSRNAARWYVVALGGTSALAVVLHGVHSPDVILDAVASLGVVAIVLRRPALPMRLRLSLVVYFGLGWATWLANARWVELHPNAHEMLPTWVAYQLTRLAGVLLFCWAVVGPERRLRALR